jgi:ElaB/YqjD/DUF883 family membrane-anchored ribosome-binding protein
MELRTDEFNQAKGKLAGDIKTVVTDGEDLLKAAANVSGAGITLVRDTLGEKISNAKAGLVDASRPAVDKARKSAAAIDGYVHGNPWTVIGVAAIAGLLIGFLSSKR